MPRQLPIRAYPDPAYRCDGAAQARVNESAYRLWRFFLICFAGMFASAAAAFLCAAFFKGTETQAWVFAFCFVAFFSGPVYLALRRPRVNCGSCGGKFRKEWVEVPGGSRELFLVCDGCRTYVYTHLGAGD